MTRTTSRPSRAIGPLRTALLLVCALGCTHRAVDDCGGKVLGVNEPRIRSSHFRMLLADLPAAAHRFAPHAAMSALAYAEDEDCGTSGPKLTADERDGFVESLRARGWAEVKDVEWVPPCEDDVGLFFRVWEHADTRHVVMAFRGTWGVKDWLYGNLNWLTRHLPVEDQYSRVRHAVQRVFDRFPDEAGRATRFTTTGHSLGGGLAQHVLYSYPEKVAQAIVFDPSSVTGFTTQSRQKQVRACECSSSELNGEPRIFRVYDAYEILSNLRIFHKIFLSPERHVQEVRFPNAASHSMSGLTRYLLANEDPSPSSGYSDPWYAGKGKHAPDESCTDAFARRQRTSCQAEVTPDQWIRCPQ